MAVYWPTPDFKGRTFNLCVLNRWDLNLFVRSSPLRGVRGEGGTGDGETNYTTSVMNWMHEWGKQIELPSFINCSREGRGEGGWEGQRWVDGVEGWGGANLNRTEPSFTNFTWKRARIGHGRKRSYLIDLKVRSAAQSHFRTKGRNKRFREERSLRSHPSTKQNKKKTSQWHTTVRWGNIHFAPHGCHAPLLEPFLSFLFVLLQLRVAELDRERQRQRDRQRDRQRQRQRRKGPIGQTAITQKTMSSLEDFSQVCIVGSQSKLKVPWSLLNSFETLVSMGIPRSGELRMQKLKSHLVRTQSLNVLPL